MEEPKKKPTDVGTAGAQADALEAESPTEDKAEGGEAGDSSIKRMGKAVNQGSQTTGAVIEKKGGGSILARKTAGAPPPEASTADLAAAARKAAAPKPVKQMADMSDDEIDSMAKSGNLGAVAYRKSHPRKQ